MPRTFDPQVIAQALKDIERELAKPTSRNLDPTKGEVSGAGASLISAMPTKEGGDELLTISVLVF